VTPSRAAPFFFLLTTFAAFPRLAYAAPPDTSPGAPATALAASADEQAAQLMIAGNRAFKEGRFAAAEEAYEAAFALKKGYDIAGNLGAAELAQGKHREAAEHLAFTLRLFPITGDPALREQMKKAFDQAQKEVGALRLKVAPAGAAVRVDGAPVTPDRAPGAAGATAQPAGDAPAADEIFVDPGEHVVEAVLDGYTGAPQHVSVAKGASVEVAITLSAIPPPAPPPPPPAPPKRSLVPGFVLAGVSAAGIIGGAAFLGASANKRADAETAGALITAAHKSCIPGASNYDTVRCPPLLDTLHADDTFHDVAVGVFVGAGVAGASAIAYSIWAQARPRPSVHDVRVTPVLGGDARGVIVSGAF
jgi:hypothetical protein